jgi:hypothetical protein
MRFLRFAPPLLRLCKLSAYMLILDATSGGVHMPKYGKKAQEKVEKAMHEYKRGDLKSSSGAKVNSKKQAIAIGLSEAREAGGKVPSRSAVRARTSRRRAASSRSRSRSS